MFYLRSETHDDETDHEAAKSAIGVVHDLGDGGDGEDGVANFSNDDRPENCLIATKVGIGDVGSKKGQNIGPEGVEGGDVEGNLLSKTETTRLSFIGVRVESSSRGSWPGLGDEVGDQGGHTVPGHALDELDEGNGVDPPVDTGGDTIEGLQFLLGGVIVEVVFIDIAVLHGCFTLGGEERRWGDSVGLWVLALGIARGIDESRVNAQNILRGWVSMWVLVSSLFSLFFFFSSRARG